jgi:hypothetical protein
MKYVPVAALVFLLAAPAHSQVRGNADQVVLITAAPVFLSPDAMRTPLRMLPVHTSLKVLEKTADWVQVEFSDSQYGRRVGYVQTQFVKVEFSASPLTPVTTPESPVPSRPAVLPASTVTVEPTARLATAPAMSTTGASDVVPVAGLAASAASTATHRPPTAIGGRSIGKTSGFCSGESPCRTFSFADKAEAVRAGLASKGRHTGLILRDSTQGFLNAMTAMSNSLNASRNVYSRPTAMGSSGFWLEAWTPAAWIAQLASTAAKEYRPFTGESVTDEMIEPVFRVIVHPDTPSEVTAAGVAGTRSVQHVVLRNESRTLVVQPTSTKPNTVEVANAMGGRVSYVGIEAMFPLDGLRELRGPRGDREFIITVIGTNGNEKNFTVKEKHFSHMK